MNNEYIERIAESMYYRSGGGDWYSESEAYRDRFRQKVEQVVAALLDAGFVVYEP